MVVLAESGDTSSPEESFHVKLLASCTVAALPFV